MTGQPPYADIRFGPAVIFEVAVNKSPPVRSDDFGQYFASKEAEDKLWDLLTRCWAHEPRDRPTAMKVREVVSNPILCIETNANLGVASWNHLQLTNTENTF